ncbi:MAG: class I SAM-dependent RNA methyltransferase [Bacteroidetes bacterium]|nr:class I SAM-dependent RNA methyltransferase [Bacteroidota bacterium]
MENKADSFRMIAKTISGLEEVLARELEELGAKQVRTVNRGAAFFGDKKLLYKANYCCRTALRILQPIAVFEAANEQKLYDGIGRIDWSEYLDINGTFAVSGVTTYSNITHSKYLALKTKDAIADQFREKFGKRPNVKLDNPDLAINVRIFRDECTVSIDSSGDSLHKRGYRVATGPAPISEVLAAGMVLLSGWDGTTNFIDPMCGSGTIPIEAGLIACHIPPGSFREEYSFKHWNNYEPELWEEVRLDAEAKRKNEIPGKIIGSDWSGRVLQTARENVRSAGLEHVVKLGVDFIRDTIPPEGKGIMISNPPYGERIKPHDIEKLYSEIGDSLKKNFTGYSAWIISSHKEAMKHVGLRPSRNLTVFNGQLECRLACFEMYEGSKKDQYLWENEEQPSKKSFGKPDHRPSGKSFDKPKKEFHRKERNYREKNRNERPDNQNRHSGNKRNRGNRNTN